MGLEMIDRILSYGAVCNMDLKKIRPLVFTLFFISGACGLIYETVWVRMMTLVFGITVYAVSTVLVSFMTGLALGSIYFGRLADKSRRLLLIYGALEIGIAVCALLFGHVLKWIEPLFIQIYHSFYSNYYLFCLIRFLIILPILLVPTFLMGGTLPIVSRFFVRGQRSVGRDIGLLYGVNTAGAVVGTFAVGFIMLAALGMRHSIQVAAALNLLVGIIAIALAARFQVQPEADRGGHAESAAPVRSAQGGMEAGLSRKFGILILWAIGMSGFASLGLQVLWNRMLVFHTHNSTYAFSSILIVFLIGLTVGSCLYSLLAPRIRRSIVFFALIEAGIGVWSIVSLYLVGHLSGLNEYLAEMILWNNWYEVIVLILIQVSLILLFPTILMGMTLPLAIRLMTQNVREVGKGVGNVYGANTLGTVVGTFAVGFVLIPLVGVRTTFIIIASINMLIAVALLLCSREWGRKLRWSGSAVCFLFILGSQMKVPGDIVVKDYVHSLGKVVFYDEDVTDTVMAIDLYDNAWAKERKPMKEKRMVVFADGRGTAGIPSRSINRFAGHLPMLLSKNPKDVLEICIGAGNTIGALAKHKRMQHLDCVDISKGVVKATEYFETNGGVLKPPLDRRIAVHVEDGRNFLLGSKKKYDVIGLDPPEVHTAGVVFLYTTDFYKICKARLKPGGIMILWLSQYTTNDADLRRLLATFHKVFPHGTVWQEPTLTSIYLVGSDRPIRVPLRNVYNVQQREPELVNQLKEDSMEDPLKFFSLLLMDEGSVARYSKGAEIMTDDKTIIDYTNPRNISSGFGYIHMLSPNGWNEFFANGVAAINKGCSAGWPLMANLTVSTSNVAGIIDWAGFTPAEKQAAILKINRYIFYRRSYAATHPLVPPNVLAFNLPDPLAKVAAKSK